MIAFIQGKIIDSDASSLTILANAVGYRVFVPSTIAHGTSHSNSIISLYTYLHVKEGILDLYGFESPTQRSLFKLLISVSGIGPRTGLAIIDIGSVEAISGAITNQNESFFTQVSGIGPRGAKKIIFELKGKMSNFDITNSITSSNLPSEATDALRAMGYSMPEITSTLSQIDISSPVEDVIKNALKLLDTR